MCDQFSIFRYMSTEILIAQPKFEILVSCTATITNYFKCCYNFAD